MAVCAHRLRLITVREGGSISAVEPSCLSSVAGDNRSSPDNFSQHAWLACAADAPTLLPGTNLASFWDKEGVAHGRLA